VIHCDYQKKKGVRYFRNLREILVEINLANYAEIFYNKVAGQLPQKTVILLLPRSADEENEHVKDNEHPVS
jgi:hypothetical protein